MLGQKYARCEITVMVHVTEDPSKVTSSVIRILPNESANKMDFTQTEVSGHYGNPILLLKSCLGQKEACLALGGILSRLSPLDTAKLNKELAKHFDEKQRFHVRLDKQRAFLGECTFAANDTINFTFRLGSSANSLEELASCLHVK